MLIDLLIIVSLLDSKFKKVINFVEENLLKLLSNKSKKLHFN